MKKGEREREVLIHHHSLTVLECERGRKNGEPNKANNEEDSFFYFAFREEKNLNPQIVRGAQEKYFSASVPRVCVRVSFNLC